MHSFLILLLTTYLLTQSEAVITYRKNHLSHLTEAEFKKYYLRTYVNPKPHTQQFTSKNTVTIPDQLDWRHKGVVNPVKDQGFCGSCWAFALVSTIESSVAINSGHLYSLSEQQIVDCDIYDWGCQGGSVDGGLKYTENNSICTDDYKYDARQGECQICLGVVNVTDSKFYGNFDQMIEAIQSGPLLAHIDATELQNYGSGIIDDTVPCKTRLNHAVTIVGYGHETTGTNYWIVRNSWGCDWGENGYFRIVMGCNKCGIEEFTYGIQAKALI